MDLLRYLCFDPAAAAAGNPSPPPASVPANVAPPSVGASAPDNAASLQGQAVALVNAARAKSASYAAGAMPADVEATVNAMLDSAIDLQTRASALVEGERRQKAATDILDRGRAQGPILPGLHADASGGPAGDDVEARTVEMRAKSGSVERVVLATAAEADEVRAFRAYLTDDALGLPRFTQQHDRTLRQKALSAGISTSGGYLVPSAFMAELIPLLRDRVWMRTAARVLPPLAQAADVSVSSVEANLGDADWTTELKPPTQDTTEPFGKRKLHPHPLNREILVSRTLLRLAEVNVEAWVREQIADAFAAPEERAFMVGTGAQQPEGLFTATTVTNITSAASPTALAADDIVNVEFSLKAQYRARASWVMHRTTLLAVHLLKDGNGQYMLVPGLAAGARFTLRGYPVLESEYAPGTLAASQDVAMLGDLNAAYWIVDSLALEVQRLVEIAARTNQDSFIARKETDGMVVNPQGLAKLRMAAA